MGYRVPCLTRVHILPDSLNIICRMNAGRTELLFTRLGDRRDFNKFRISCPAVRPSPQNSPLLYFFGSPPLEWRLWSQRLVLLPLQSLFLYMLTDQDHAHLIGWWIAIQFPLQFFSSSSLPVVRQPERTNLILFPPLVDLFLHFPPVTDFAFNNPLYRHFLLLSV